MVEYTKVGRSLIARTKGAAQMTVTAPAPGERLVLIPSAELRRQLGQLSGRWCDIDMGFSESGDLMLKVVLGIEDGDFVWAKRGDGYVLLVAFEDLALPPGVRRATLVTHTRHLDEGAGEEVLIVRIPATWLIPDAGTTSPKQAEKIRANGRAAKAEAAKAKLARKTAAKVANEPAT